MFLFVWDDSSTKNNTSSNSSQKKKVDRGEVARSWFLQQFSHWFQVEIALVIASPVDSKFVLEVVETGRLAGRWDGLGWKMGWGICLEIYFLI